MPVAVEISTPDDQALARAEAFAALHRNAAVAWLEAPMACVVRLDEAPESLDALAGLEVRVHPLDALDYEEAWSAALRPHAVGPLWIVPPRASAPPGADPVVTLAETGVAFGSGLHPTTRMCLEHMVAAGPAVSTLDVGTGTGILGLAALALGGERAVGTELDPEARRVAEVNARHAGLPLVVLGDDALYTLEERFDLVVANVLGPELIALAPAIVRRLNSGATLLLSGVRPDIEQEVASTYVRLGLAHLSTHEDQSWQMLELIARW